MFPGNVAIRERRILARFARTAGGAKVGRGLMSDCVGMAICLYIVLGQTLEDKTCNNTFRRIKIFRNEKLLSLALLDELEQQ
jgi:hypothetical protein